MGGPGWRKGGKHLFTAAKGGGYSRPATRAPWRHVAAGGTPDRRMSPDHQTARRRAAPARFQRRARQDAPRQRRSATPGRNSRQEPGECGPRTSQQNFLFCAPVCGLVHKTPILLIWLVGPAPPGGAIHPPGARGPRPPLWWAPAVALWGGYYDTPPWVLCALCQ